MVIFVGLVVGLVVVVVVVVVVIVFHKAVLVGPGDSLSWRFQNIRFEFW